VQIKSVSAMNKETRLINKVKRLLRKVNIPDWLHRFGPKKYRFCHHAAALIVRAVCRLSFRKVVWLLRNLSIRCPAKSTLNDTVRKIPSALWQKLLALTHKCASVAAIDSTGLSRTNPSHHYLFRMGRKLPKTHVKLSILADTENKRFLDAEIRVLPAHDIKDAKALIGRNKFSVLVGDKGYDAEWLHRLCREKGIAVCIPVRNKGKSGHYSWSLRRTAWKTFDWRLYHRREIAEALFHALKTTMGYCVSAKRALTVRAEVYLRLIAYNLFYVLIVISGQSPFFFYD